MPRMKHTLAAGFGGAEGACRGWRSVMSRSSSSSLSMSLPLLASAPLIAPARSMGRGPVGGTISTLTLLDFDDDIAASI